ncbi:MAG: hypothetical protein U1E36_02415 [Rickettsiales bacterium]
MAKDGMAGIALRCSILSFAEKGVSYDEFILSLSKTGWLGILSGIAIVVALFQPNHAPLLLSSPSFFWEHKPTTYTR